MKMENGKIFPFKLEIGVWMNGKSHPIWCYDKVPDGMRLASLRDLWWGRPILTKVLLGPDEGCFYTEYVRESTIEILKARIEQGIPVYVRDSK